MSVVAIINYKGGVGKTTLAANIGAELAFRGRRVLLVDLDPQASLTFSLYRPEEWERFAEPATILPWYREFLDTGRVAPLHPYLVAPDAVNAIVEPNGGQLHLAASHLGLIEVDLDLAAELGGSRQSEANPRYREIHRILRDGLADDMLAGYDTVLIDCPPNFNMVTRTAIAACDHVLIPARPDFLSTLGIDYLRARMGAFVESYNQAAGVLEINPEILGVVYTMIQYAATGPIVSQRATMEQLSKIEIAVFQQTIRDNKTAFTQSGVASMPAVLAEPRSDAVVTLQYELQQLTSEFVAKTRL